MFFLRIPQKPAVAGKIFHNSNIPEGKEKKGKTK